MANVFAMLAARYPRQSWAYFTEVHSTLGTSHNQRRADALAFGLWQSRGFELHGHEIKTNRADVLRELADPSKADAFQRYCDRWWLVVADASLIKRDEIPETWGVLAPRGGALQSIRKAPRLTPKPWPRGFIASMLRQGSSTTVPQALYNDLQAELRTNIDTRAQQLAMGLAEQATRRLVLEHKATERELARIKEALATFERDSGISVESFTGWRVGPQAAAIGRLAQHLATGGRDLGRLAAALEAAATLAREAASTIATVPDPPPTPEAETDIAHTYRMDGGA